MITPDIDWLSDPPEPPNKTKLTLPKCPFIVAIFRPTYVISMLSNQHLDVPHLWSGMDNLGKGEMLTNMDLD